MNDHPHVYLKPQTEVVCPGWVTNHFLLPKPNCNCRVIIDGKEFQGYREKGVWHLRETQDSPPVPATPKIEKWRYE